MGTRNSYSGGTQQAKPDPLIERGMPASPDAERAVLGAILLDNGAYNLVAPVLSADDFFNPRHQRLFGRMAALREGDPPRPIDDTTLIEELLRTGELEAAGGVSYISDLTTGLPRAVNVAAYARIVKDKSILRQTIKVAESISVAGIAGGYLEDGETVSDYVARAQAQVLAIDADTGQRGLIGIAEIGASAYTAIDKLRPGTISGLATGFPKLDEIIRGLQPSELTLLAARPSMGKSALAINITANVGTNEFDRKTVALFSLEMTAVSCLIRMLCAGARVDSQQLMRGYATKEERFRLSLAMEAIAANSGIFIDDTARIGLSELRAKARRLQSERGLDLIIVDHLGLMKVPKLENRDKEIGFLSSGLKALAKDLRVPVLAVSQLKRIENRGGDFRPQLSDLRDSGNLEQDADTVLMLWREEYYLRMAGKEVPEDVKGRAELAIAKQRNGPTGQVSLAWLDRYSAFAPIAQGVQ